ncbi:MAG TPA: hypothetical protein PKD70_01280 [Saprospiraceae bacterium]|nr:hypothetical protein [Saprospiraceae bacterium]HMP12479.1 hypothetical protein [Saprospiraceae bacterium]
MKKMLFCSMLFCSAALIAQAQDYAEWIQHAEKHYRAKDYRASAEAYVEAFKANDGKGFINDRYNAACSWALAGNTDSAFVQLIKISEGGYYTNYNHLIQDEDLYVLHNDPRWQQVKDWVLSNKEKEEANLNKPLANELNTIYDEDQLYRRMIDSVDQQYGWESEEMKTLWAKIAEVDAVNLQKVKAILDEYGWLGSDVVGGKGAMALFLVIQHADLEVQIHYLPMMREAAKAGKAQPNHLAMLEDRVAMRQGNKQIYGSQVTRNQETGKWEVAPIRDPLQVDARRAEVGLGPLADYLKRWEIEWDSVAHEKAHGNK